MLIGLSGYISSGKSTVAMLIQALTMKSSDGITGKGRYAEDPLLYLQNYDGRPNLKGGWEIKAYATKLKQMVSLLTGIPVEDLEKESVKSSQLGKEWDYILKTIRASDDKFTLIPGPVAKGMEDRAKHYTVRTLLQKLGTEACRNQIHENIWVNALFSDYGERAVRPVLQGGRIVDFEEFNGPDYPNWVISDVRFPNEADAIKERGGIMVRINRSKEFWKDPEWLAGKKVYREPVTLERLTPHSSETSLDTYGFFDYVIENSGTLEELLEQVRTMLLHFKIIN